MPTSFQFNSTQLAEIKRLRDIADAPANKQLAGGGVALYSYVFKCVSGIDVTNNSLTGGVDTVLAAAINTGMPQNEHISLIWLYGALQVNKGVGAFSEVIRQYNIRQGELRGMSPFDKPLLDQASNAVAVLFADSILNPKLPNSTLDNPSYQKLPTIQEIGNTDLNGVRNTLYPGNDTPNKELYLNQAWPGIVMLGSLGGQYTDRLLRYNENQPLALDSLADIKSMLFAWDSFKTAYDKTPLSSFNLSDALIALNWPASFVSTAVNEYAANGASSLPQFIFSTLAASQNADAKKGLDTIAKLGSNTFLDMLMGAIQGKSLIGTTKTDADFQANAKSFLGALTPAQLQVIKAELLPLSASGLASTAGADTASGANARAALAALSVVSVQVSPTVADQFKLFDPATGQGSITQNWITDRAAFTAGFYAQQLINGASPGAVANVAPGNYKDLVSNTEVTVGLPVPDKRQFIFGGESSDTISGQRLADHLYGGGGADTLNGLGGADYLEGGAGSDTYRFTGSFGKDLVVDTDGQGTIQIDGTTLGTAKGIGERGAWAFELGGGVVAGLAVYDDARSSTGKRLVITRGADSADTITIDNFDLTAAQGSQGYLGIKLGGTQLAITASSANNVWSDLNFNLTSLSGQTSRMVEGSGKSFTIYLNQGAKAGDTVTLALSALGDKFQAILGDSVVAANGAVITLAEGQTQVSFALVQEGEVTSDASLQLSASYTGANSSATSNAWGVNLSDAGALTKTYTGDQRAPTIASGTYNWGVTSWAADGTLTGGVAEADFADVLEGSTGNDKLSGLGGNDALDGGAGNDQIDSMGGSYCLDARDVIFGDASLLGACLLRPVDYTNAATLEVSLSQQPKGSEHGDDVIDVGDGSGEDDLANYTEMQEQGNGLIAIESIVFFTHSIGAAGQFCKNPRAMNNTNYRCAA